ncbi:molecular chaperone GroEL [Caballeronia pedi]|uniref:Molecular chaperone GroEL n=1 Tax=Caballeronia pedi TaxID=1777141 RepID=A0A157ZRJ4_9BURK|nr:TCP-1/cpn60 chaperonin family protein [Caballeronia pedi]SAK48154.1 molecular chaperone GroEL [Caballeronia pedi]
MQALNTSTIVTGERARELILRALRTGTRAIGSSLGPYGLGLMFDGGSGSPIYSASGLDIARRITNDSGAASVALRILKDALWQTKRELGDGTARTACMAVGIYAEATKHIASGLQPALLNKAILQLQTELPALVEAQKCRESNNLDVALSACMDEELARAIAALYSDLPERGAIDVQQARGSDIDIERYSGYCLDVLPETIGASVEEQGLRFEMDSVHVLVVNEVISDFGSLARILDQFASRGKSLAIVARGFEGVARGTLAANRAALRMHVLGLVPAEVGEQAIHVLDDLCVSTGATVISEETGTAIGNVRPSMLGSASRLVVEGGRAIFSEPKGDAETIRQRRTLVLAQAQKQQYLELDREKLLRRSARLAGDCAVLYVGAQSHWEAEQRVDGAYAALAALKAVDESGVVPGGGVAFKSVADSLAKLGLDTPSDLRRAAIACVAAGAGAVAAQISKNAGDSLGDAEVRYRPIDPMSTTLAILQHAVSLAATMLTVEVLIC